MTINAIETTLARLAFQSNQHLTSAVVINLLDKLEGGAQNFTADELLIEILGPAVKYQIEQNQKQANAYNDRKFPDFVANADLNALAPETKLTPEPIAFGVKAEEGVLVVK